jgi:urea transport system permease protein
LHCTNCGRTSHDQKTTPRTALRCRLSAHAALDPAQVRQLAAEDSADKVAAIRQLTQTADPDAVRVLQAMADDALYVARDKALIISGEQAFDAATGAAVDMPAEPEAVTVNNRLRGELANALAALKLFDADTAVRRASAQALQASADAGMAPLLARALERETDAGIKALLVVAHAQATLGDADPAVRLAAVKALADTASPTIKSLLLPLTDKAGEADDKVRYAAIEAVKAIDGRLAVAENLGRVFSGLSLGSILLLAALGLAITYG